MKEAREHLVLETDIIGLIRCHRFYRMAIERLLTPAVIKQLESKSEYTEISGGRVDEKRIHSDAPHTTSVLPINN